MKKWLLVGIVGLGFLLRVVGLSSHPAGFTPDEASLGYDAYSILKTGKDQWGHTLPLAFKSFGDDKLPVYTYLAVPSVAIFGLNEFAVRLPNAILGSLAVLAVYFLVQEIFNRKDLALLSAFFLAISPWHVMLSRGAFEANLTTFFLPLAIFLFLKSIKNSRFLILAFLVFLINIFTYHTARILTPLVLFSLIFIYKKELINSKVFKIWGILAGVLFIIAIIGFLLGGSRVASSGIFDLGFSSDRYFAQVVGEPNIISVVFYNKPVYIVRQFVNNYLSYFSPQFLFLNGPAEGTYGMVPGIGVLYFVEIIFLIAFLVKIVKEKVNKENLFLIFWILISPIPAALTKGPGYAANRAAFAIIPLEIMLSIGGIYFYEKLKNKRWKQYFVIGSVILLLVNFVFVFEKYWVGQSVNQAPDMIYGVNQIASNLKKQENKKIVISKNVSEPQIYAAFYNQIDPVEYQNASKNWNLVNGWVDQQGSYSLNNLVFRNINYSVDQKLKNTVLVGKPSDFPAEITPDFVVNYPNFKPAYYIVVNK